MIPAPAVLHTHPNSLLSVCNTANGAALVRELYGDRAVVVPYVMPGFAVARLGASLFRELATPDTVGVVLLHHGLFTFADTPRRRTSGWSIWSRSPTTTSPPT